jgi:hypothetical protein
MPMSKADFTDAKQLDFKNAVANAAKVDVSLVSECMYESCMHICIYVMKLPASTAKVDV